MKYPLLQWVIVAWMILLCISPSMAEGNKPRAVKRFEKGALYPCGVYTLADLSGSYRQMGRQYGALKKQDLQDIYRFIEQGYSPASRQPEYSKYMKLAQEIFQSYPARYRQFFSGMAETSGLNLDQLMAVNNLEAYQSLVYGSAGCSFLAAKDPYTSDGRFVCGRNFDGAGLQFAKWLNIIVLHPSDGSLPFAFFGYTGVIFVTTGINSEGLFLALNNAGPGNHDQERQFAPVTLWTALENSANLEDLTNWLSSVRPDSHFNYIINAVYQQEACSIEWHHRQTLTRSYDVPGLLASTNHYVGSGWQEKFIGVDQVLSKERRERLINRADEYKGGITLEVMAKMMAVPIDQGGVMFENPPLTAFQIIVEPDSQRIWMRAPQVKTGWETVELSRFLKGKPKR